jgi:hypothetical protein
MLNAAKKRNEYNDPNEIDLPALLREQAEKMV